jgi:HPt (histidine-containing phosphotransfer) domain-containing protein
MSDRHDGLPGLRVLDPDRLHTLGEETGLGLRGVAELFVDQMGDQLAELRAAIDSGAPEAVSQMAHKCAGSAVLAGMERLTGLLRELEHSPEARLGDPARCVASLEREFGAVTGELSALLANPDGGARVQP